MFTDYVDHVYHGQQGHHERHEHRGHQGYHGHQDQGYRGHQGHGHGPWGRAHHSGRGQIVPYLAVAFLARAALRYAQDHAAEDHPGRGPRAWGDWPSSEGRGDRRDGPPWRRGEWGREWGRDRGPWQGPGREGARGLRHDIQTIVALVRAADARQIDEVRAVLADARKRIAAILAEAQPARANVANV